MTEKFLYQKSLSQLVEGGGNMIHIDRCIIAMNISGCTVKSLSCLLTL